MVAPLLHIDGLQRRFGTRRVLDGFSLDLAAGEIVGLLGPNGCGKSTLLNIVAQLLPADAGRVLLDGEALGPGSRRLIGLCAQQPALYPDLLPAENLHFQARIHGLPANVRKHRVAELMDRFGLAPHAGTRAGRLSGGWQQRLHLAVALVHKPALLLLDEPTAAVDTAARHALWTLIDSLRAEGTAIVLCTHQLAEAEQLCSRVALMRDGRVAAVGTLPELLARVPARAVAQVHTRDAAATTHRAQRLGWAVRPARGAESVVERPGSDTAAHAVLNCLLPALLSLGEVVRALDGPELQGVSVQPVTLEQVYLDLLHGPGFGAPF